MLHAYMLVLICVGRCVQVGIQAFVCVCVWKSKSDVKCPSGLLSTLSKAGLLLNLELTFK